MNVLMDNSTFRAISRCVTGEANSENDLKDLLQFINSYLLAERIYVPGFVHEKVKFQVQDGIDTLALKGIDATRIMFTNEKQNQFKEICSKTVNNFLTFFSSPEISDVGEELPLRVYSIVNKKIPEHDIPHSEDINCLVNNIESKSLFEDIEKSDFSDHEFGAVGYMISSSEELRDYIKARRDSWSLKTSYQLIAILRFYLNEMISQSCRSDYLPNIARAKILEANNFRLKEMILNLVSKGLLSALMKRDVMDKYPNIPVFSKALLYKSEGNIERLLELAVEGREKTRELRKKIHSRLGDTKNREIELWQEIEKEIVYLVDIVKNDLCLNRSISEHIRMKVISGVPVPTPSNATTQLIENWIRKIRNKKQVSLITEYAGVLNSPVKDEYAFEKMYRSVSKNTSKSRRMGRGT